MSLVQLVTAIPGFCLVASRDSLKEATQNPSDPGKTKKVLLSLSLSLSFYFSFSHSLSLSPSSSLTLTFSHCWEGNPGLDSNSRDWCRSKSQRLLCRYLIKLWSKNIDLIFLLVRGGGWERDKMREKESLWLEPLSFSPLSVSHWCCQKNQSFLQSPGGVWISNRPSASIGSYIHRQMDGLAVPGAFHPLFFPLDYSFRRHFLSQQETFNTPEERKTNDYVHYLFIYLKQLFFTLRRPKKTHWWWTGCHVFGSPWKRKWVEPDDRKKGFNSGTMASNSGTTGREAVSEPIRRRTRRKRRQVEEKVWCSRNFEMKWEEKKEWS